MPGIAGIISPKTSIESIARVRPMIEVMRSEKFYEATEYFAPEMNVYAGTVTFDDSHNGIISDESGNITLIVFGECFTGSEIMTGKQLIRLYQEEGQIFVEKLNGLFSGLLIDRQQRKIVLFNDRYGMRRIYFHEEGGDFYFASEAKALLRILPELRHFDPEGVADFLTFGCTLDWKTLFRGIEILPGASVWTFEAGNRRKQTYFSPETWESQPQLTGDEFEGRFREAFKNILPRYFKSNSKIGVALTGGLDTRMIMACRPQNNGHTTSYTFSGNNGRTLDDKIAARIAAASHLEHSLLRLDSDFFSDFPAHADKTVFATDGCAGICNAHEIYFNRKARQLAPVRLTGNFGGEILRGISTFKGVSLSPWLFNSGWRTKINCRGEKLSAHKGQPVTFAAFKEVPWNLFGNLAAGWSQLQFRTPYLDNELVALAFQAPRQARESSLPSFRLVRANNAPLSEIPTDRGYGGNNSGLKFLSRRVFAELTFKLDYYSTAGLPRAVAAFNPIFNPIVSKLKIAGLHKFLRYSTWFRNELSTYVREVFRGSIVRASGIWNPKFLDTMLDEHFGGSRDFSSEINAVMTLEGVERLFFRC